MPTYTVDQDGYKTAGGLWADNDTILGINIANPIGLRFQLHTEFDSQNRPLDPSIIWPKFDLWLTINSPPVQDHILELRFVPEAAPVRYADAFLPLDRGEIVMFNKDGDSFGLQESPVRVLNGTAAGTQVGFEDVDPAPLAQYMRNSNYNGYVCFTIRYASLGGNISFVATENVAQPATSYGTLDTQEVPFHTGVLDGPAVGRRARTRIDPKLGVPVASDAMVRDGWRDGLMVTPEAYDSEDPYDRYVPDPNEGVVDDEF